MSAIDIRELKIVYTDWYPYTYSVNGEAEGFEIEILKAVLEKMNYRCTFEELPWNRCLLHLRNGEADMLVSMVKNNDRMKYTYYPEEYISRSHLRFYSFEGNNIYQYQSLLDFMGKEIGVINGFSYGNEFDSADYLEKDSSLNSEVLLQKVYAGRNDYGVDNYAVVSSLARKKEISDSLVFLNPPLQTLNLYVGFSKVKDYKEFSERFSEELSKFKISEKYAEIIKSYGIDIEEMR